MDKGEEGCPGPTQGLQVVKGSSQMYVTSRTFIITDIKQSKFITLADNNTLGFCC